MALACLAYIHGLIDGMQFGRFFAKEYCPPKAGLSVDQAQLVITKYLRGHPEHLHEDAGTLAGPALLDAFPCKKSN